MIATLLFFTIIFDMFVYGKAGRKAPYVIKVLTQMQLSELLILQKKTAKLNILSIKSLVVLIFADATHEWQFGFQDPATPLMEGIIDLHHDIMFFLI